MYICIYIYIFTKKALYRKLRKEDRFDIKTYFPKSFETLQSIGKCICHKHQESVLQLL